MTDAFENMDRMYRHQRYFYDITRKFYLLGDSNKRNLWIAASRDVGGIVFLLLRDHYGVTQVVSEPSDPFYGDLVAARVESTVRIEGTVTGSISTERDLIVGENAKITADVQARNAINQELRDELRARGRVSITVADTRSNSAAAVTRSAPAINGAKSPPEKSACRNTTSQPAMGAAASRCRAPSRRSRRRARSNATAR